MSIDVVFPMTGKSLSAPQRYRAPSRHGEILAIPEFNVAIENAKQNAQRLNAERTEISGLPLNELRRLARREVISRAVAWTNEITGQAVACAECSHQAALLFVTGHQPQLAHPGVWAKNFAASGLAEKSQGVGLNIVVDNDTVGTQAIRVPTGSPAEPRYTDVSFDSAQPQQPWEELRLHNPELFESFADRVRHEMEAWGIEPVIEQMWPDAVRTSRRTDSMVDCLSACRIEQERRLGVTNLEVPLSEICQTEAFLLFARHLIVHSAQFHGCYNSIVKSYRLDNGIRNDRHPVPNLVETRRELELPFWYWHAGDSERGQVFVRQEGEQFELICRGEIILLATVDNLLEELRELQTRGKLRTRALTTTLFSRLCFADLFIHGIGGAKYDEMTDLLMAEFFGIEPPHFLVLSATLHLPIAQFDIEAEDLRKLKMRLRDHEFNPDRYLEIAETGDLIARKQELIQEHWNSQTTGLPKRERVKRRIENRRRHLELKAVNAALNELAAKKVADLKEQVAIAELQLKANSILKSREFPAAIYPVQEISKLAQSLMNLDSAGVHA